MIQIDVRGADAVIRKQCILTSGTAGVQVRFRFSSEWDQLTKTAVFRAGNVTRDVVKVDETVTIPHECLAASGVCLQIGVYGTNSDQKVIIPTVWARTNLIRPGVDPSGDPGTDPSLPVWAALNESKMEKVADSDLNMAGHSIVGANDVQADSFTLGSIPDDEGSYSEVTVYTESPVLDDNGNKQYGTLLLEDIEYGQPVRVKNIAPGSDDNDAATVGQLNAKAGTVYYNINIEAKPGQLKQVVYDHTQSSKTPHSGDVLISRNGLLFVVEQDLFSTETGTTYMPLRAKADFNTSAKNRTIISRDPVEKEDHDFSTPYGFDSNSLSAIPYEGDLIIDLYGNAYTATSDGARSEDGYNINVMLRFEGNITEPANAVLYTPQTPTPAQQAQARQNMGVLNPYVIPVNTSENSPVIECEFNWDELVYAVKAGSYVACMTYNSQESYGKPASDASVDVFPLDELSIEDGVARFEKDSILFKNAIEIYNDGTITQRSVEGTDKTLTKSGRAADAAVVGEKLGDIETALDGIIALQEEMIGGDAV